MAHTLGTNSSHTSGTANPLTFTFTTNVADTVVVLLLKVNGATNRAGGAPTFHGVPMTQASTTQKAASSPEASAELWYLLGPPVGSTLTFSIPNTGGLTIWHMAATGRAAAGLHSAVDAAPSGANGTSTNPAPGAIVTTVNGDIGFAVVATGAQTWAPSAQAGTVLNNTDDGATGTGRQYHLQATAASINLNWTFGTSDDWGAVAVYFKEVEPPPIGKLAEQPNPIQTPRLAGLASFVLGSSALLLQPPAAAPFSQTEWPVPPSPPVIQTTVETRPQVDGVQAFNQTDWPIPAPRTPLGVGFVHQPPPVAAPAVPFHVDDWPVFRGQPVSVAGLTWTLGLQQSTLAPAETPFRQEDWPQHARPFPADLTWTPNLLASTLTPAAGPSPFAQPDWALPLQAASNDRSWTQNLLETTLAPAVGAAPFAQPDWAVPSRALGTFLVQTETRPQEDGAPPIRPPDWPIPTRLAARDLTWLQSPAPPAAPVGDPFNQPDWPVPGRSVPRAELTWLQSPAQVPPGPQPFAQPEWPVPLAPPRLGTLTTWTVARPAFYVEPPQPFSQSLWPVPAPARSVPITHRFFAFWYALDDTAPGPPLNWPLPLRARPHVVVTTPPNLLLTTLAVAAPAGVPFTQTAWPIPLRRTWELDVQVDVFDPEVGAVPGRQADWPVPARPRPWTRPADTSVNLALFPPPVVVAAPFAQADWPVPARRRPSPETVSPSLLQTTLVPGVAAVPPGASWTAVPLVRPQARAVAFTDSILLSTLTPPAGAGPFPIGRQQDWPTPRPRHPVSGLLATTGGASSPFPPSTPDIHRVAVEEYFSWQRVVISTTSTPPATPARGDRYIVGAAPTGVWVGHATHLAWFNGAEWKFDVPATGWAVVDQAATTLYFYKAGAWVVGIVF
jgi:hypothetical protein